jgi:hypothetical protein
MQEWSEINGSDAGCIRQEHHALRTLAEGFPASESVGCTSPHPVCHGAVVATFDCSVPHCPSALHCTALHCTALHCTALPCTALHCTALHCTALHPPRCPEPGLHTAICLTPLNTTQYGKILRPPILYANFLAALLCTSVYVNSVQCCRHDR